MSAALRSLKFKLRSTISQLIDVDKLFQSARRRHEAEFRGNGQIAFFILSCFDGDCREINRQNLILMASGEHSMTYTSAFNER